MALSQSTANAVTNNAVVAVDFFVGEALAKAQLALYRGFLHEVNNTLAGVGTLAEAMKGSEPATMDANLDLIASTTARAALMERRLRSLNNAPMASMTLEVGNFIKEHRDILDLMLPRSMKQTWEVTSHSTEVSPLKLLNVVLVAFTLARERAGTTLGVHIGAQMVFNYGPVASAADMAAVARIQKALEAMSIGAGLVYEAAGDTVTLSFQA